MRDRFNAPIEYDARQMVIALASRAPAPAMSFRGCGFRAEVHALLSTLQLLDNLQPGLLEDR